MASCLVTVTVVWHCVVTVTVARNILLVVRAHMYTVLTTYCIACLCPHAHCANNILYYLSVQNMLSGKRWKDNIIIEVIFLDIDGVLVINSA